MLDPKEDYGNVDERLATSLRKEGSLESAVVKTDHVCNRVVYKLVKVRDDGSVLAATEDDAFPFLVGGPEISGLASYDPEASNDAIGEDEENARSDYVASDGEDLSITNRVKSIPIEDLAIERQSLKAQIEVLDCILMKVDLEGRKRLLTNKEVGKMGNFGPTYINTYGVGPRNYKRQRRPNPKYFDTVYDSGDSDLVLIGPPTTSLEQMMPRQAISSPKKAHPRSSASDIGVNSARRVTSAWGSARHRARSSSSNTFTRIPCKVHEINTSMASLDNLSIRELHKAFSSTYGRETSVKDKHWLKHQISAGWLRHEQDHDVGQSIQSSNTTITTTTTSSFHQNKLKARLDSCATQKAQQPLQTTTTVTPTLNQRDQVVNDNQEANDHVEHNFNDHAFRSRLGSRCFHRRVTTPTILSTSCIYGEVVNNGEPVVEGKRQRKPNRRYIEDEAYMVSSFVPIHETSSLFSGEPLELGNSATNYSLRAVETDGTSKMTARHSSAQTGSHKFSPLERPKLMSSKMENGMMAERNQDLATRFDLVSSANMQKLDLHEIDNDVQPSGLVFDSKVRSRGVDQVIASEFDSGQQMVVTTMTVSTVPTSSGGTRRKHHKPWTLQEVMTLVEGVARCGGGKWADIKKLAFSTVAYRTAVDLKEFSLFDNRVVNKWVHYYQDKWRNLLRASCSQLHPAKQGERKKKFTAAIPAPILSRVRELASLPNQFPFATVTSMSSISCSGCNIVHQR